MSRPNKCIKDKDGNDVWVVRSSVVIPIVFKWDRTTGDIYTLLEQRGAAVTHTGEWCCPCGYIDWDETMEEACQRELKEETGMDVNIQDIRLFDVTTDKDSKTQSIDHWYVCWATSDFNMENVETKDEILQLSWLKVGNWVAGNPLTRTSPTLKLYTSAIDAGLGKWAFRRHHEYIKKMLKNEFKAHIIEEI